jgi:hypothetical protein
MRWTRTKSVFDENAISHELDDIGDTRPSRWARTRLDFNRDETIGRLDEIVGLPNESISARDQRASQRPPAAHVL